MGRGAPSRSISLSPAAVRFIWMRYVDPRSLLDRSIATPKPRFRPVRAARLACGSQPVYATSGFVRVTAARSRMAQLAQTQAAIGS